MPTGNYPAIMLQNNVVAILEFWPNLLIETGISRFLSNQGLREMEKVAFLFIRDNQVGNEGSYFEMERREMISPSSREIIHDAFCS